MRDAAFRAETIFHEYGHGVSLRLTGGPNVNCLNGDEQAGEGWSDFLAIVFLMNPAIDDPEGPRGYGQWALYADSRVGPGFRPRPYSRNMELQPFTYDSIKDDGWLDGTSLALPHGLGHGWAPILWDMAWDLVDKHGFNPNAYGAWNTGGNNRALQYVIDGLKMQGCEPGLVVARSAIVAAAAGADRRRGHVHGVGGVRAPRPRLQRRAGRRTEPRRQHGGVRHAPGLPARVRGGGGRIGAHHRRRGLAVSRCGSRPTTATAGWIIATKNNPYTRQVDCHDAEDRHAGSGRHHAAAVPGRRRSRRAARRSRSTPRACTRTRGRPTTAWGNTCREFVLTTKTGVQHRAYFRFLAATHVDGTVGGTVPATLVADARRAGDVRAVHSGRRA